MKNLKKIVSLLVTLTVVFSACNNDDPIDPSKGKAKIENLAVSPTTNLKYGDAVTLTALFSDETGLRSFTIKVTDAAGNDIYEHTDMLTGKTFNLDKELVIPLPANATAGNVKINVTVANSGSELTSEEIELQNVTVPTFDKLYLVLNGTVYEMKKNSNVFEFEDFVPADASGKIYANANQTGIYWGLDNGVIKALGDSDIPFGKSEEAYFKISFNTGTFALTIGDTQDWAPMSSDALYIFGTISGHCEDNDGGKEIDTERTKMKMSGFSLGNRKMWTWEPPNTGSGSSEDDMWGNTVAGVFRLKKAGVEQYILYSNNKIVTGADNKDNSFPLPAAGSFKFRVLAEDGNITSVRVYDEGLEKNLEYRNDEILINGVPVISSITFANQPLNLAPGEYFIYQGRFDLAKDASVTGVGIDLAKLYCDPDVFSGNGNSTWKVIQETGNYYVRIDAFSGHVYLREESGYPKTIYLDGWCWKKHPGDPRDNWSPATATSLYRKGTTNTYEGTIYILPWGGDFKLFAVSETNAELSQMMIKSKYFDNINAYDENGIKFPVPSEPGAFYKISVDLIDGFTWDKVNMDGENYTLVPTNNNKKFTMTFTAL
jgi:hypothetical protein